MNDRPVRQAAPNAGVNGRPAVSRPEFTRRTLIVAAVVAILVAVAAAFARAYDVFFLFFAAVLLAILLRSVADALDRRTRIGPGWSLALVLFALAAAFAAGAYFLGSLAVSQFTQLWSDLPRSVDQARAYLQQRPWGRELLQHAPTAQSLTAGGPGNAASFLTSFFSTTFGVLGNLVVLTFLTIYLAASPRTYVGGMVRLVPPRCRDRAREVLNAVGFHLKWWLVGRAVAMATVGLVTLVGLWIVGVPYFLVLALVAALLTAVPFIGPIIAAIPGVLVALMQGPDAALWAVVVYTLAQAIDNYLVTPNVQQRMVNLPPVLTIVAVTLVGALFGVLGLIVAAPLAVTLMVVVKMLYVEDTLGDRLDVRGADRGP